MKRKLIILAILMMSAILVFASCGGSSDTESAEAPEATESTESAEAAQSEAAEEEAADIEVVESGYNIRDDEESTVVYGFIVRNPNENIAYQYPEVTVNVYDANGDVIASKKEYINLIPPGEVQAFGGEVECEGKSPDKVEFIPKSGDKISPSDVTVKSSDLIISDTNEEIGDRVVNITGKVKNNSANDTNCVALSAIFKKDGKIVSGAMAFLDDLSAGQEKEFEITHYFFPEYDSFEVTAMNWAY